MVLVVLGTWEMPFYRPLVEVEKIIKKGFLTEEVIVQSGNTSYKSDVMEMHRFFSASQFNDLYKDASIIIVQAGIGSIMNGLRQKKKIIAIARLEKYNEHIDDHQLEIMELFAERGYIKAWNENDDLETILNEMVDFSPNPYPFTTEKISDAIIDFIEKK